MGAGSYVRYGSHSSYVSTAHVTATFTYLRVVVRTVGNAAAVAGYGMGMVGVSRIGQMCIRPFLQEQEQEQSDVNGFSLIE
ncbi:uncharacterized protein BDR25DRAFT_358950 [Lindgomyces ingoldianus]|uniref:Uncharacterized protein n=1 Tax=Lindgomyces ingoldianus TaxID=673940 RepID=A0ACB6QIS0_9PLEO|nr:uncharacterized protein BDR25DRAFT_358950 [Lindgomyces ingoldianus]KAF2466888.1 hypothetical protein BDR25DRAFT_358950 [Lindgomyces ingoldianus]